VREAGAIVAGGHTIYDEEPKFGLAVLGNVHPERVWTKAGARPGDQLLLTKPLGVGLIATAHKGGVADPVHMARAAEWMARLNKAAAEALRAGTVHAATDITGFGLLGHVWEVAGRSGVRLRLHFDALPFHPGAFHYADELLFPAGASCNMADFGAHVSFAPRLEYEEQALLYCPETSGGLFVSLPPAEAQAFLARYRAAGHEAWAIGEVLEGEAHIEVV